MLSACLIVRNEEEDLPRCLASLQGLADEIVVEDTGSEDSTVTIARDYGALVSHHEWTGDFSFHRNRTLARAGGRYVCVIDADEEVVKTDVAETRHHLRNSDLPPLLLVRQSLLYPDDKEVVLLAPRIFRRSAGFRYVHPIHEQLDVGEVTAMLSNVQLLHHGYTSEESLAAKESRNLEIARKMEDGPHAFHCRARAGLSLADWDTVLESSAALVECDTSPALTIEACVLGGSAAYNLSRQGDFERFVDKGRAVAPDSPDIRFLELLAAGHKYLATLDGGDSTAPGEFIRPWTFWHNRAHVQMLLETLLGRRKVVFAEGDSDE